MIVEEIVTKLVEKGYKQPTTLSELIANNDVLFETIVEVLDEHLIK